MTTIIKKIKKGRTYYYAVESARVKGKPRIVWQKYLGTVQSLIHNADATKPPEPQESVIFQFGAVAALYRITQKLHLIETIDHHFPKRNQGPTIGQFIALAALNRAIDPKSKVQIGPWYEKTILKRIFTQPARAFSSQRFWDAMDTIDVEKIPLIEREIVKEAVDVFGIHPDYLLYDTTNFFTFINTFNDRNSLAQRGRNKAKRNDLRQVGLALLVTEDCHIPVMHQVYEGNITDTTIFAGLTDRIASAMRMLRSSVRDVTLVFDKGNISTDNLTRLHQRQISFVAALPSSHHRDLLEVPLSSYTPSSRFSGVRSWRTSREILGRECTVVMKYSETFYTRQLANFATTITKCTNKLHALSTELIVRREGKKKRGRKPTPSSVSKWVNQILCAQYMKDVFEISITKKKGAVTLQFSTNRDKITEISDRYFGKTILATNREDWSDEQIINAYHGQNEIEQAFKDMKDPSFLRWQPMSHWTNQKIRVHAFYCVLALMLAGLARYQLKQEGLEISTHKMLEQLSDIAEVAVLYPKTRGRQSKPYITLSRTNTLQRKMMRILQLDELHTKKG